MKEDKNAVEGSKKSAAVATCSDKQSIVETLATVFETFGQKQFAK